MSKLINYQDMLIENFGKSGINRNAKNYHTWFKQNAKLYKVINKDQSKQLSKNAMLKRCYDNCFKIASKDYNLKYIEGYTLSLVPIEHAWLINNKNEVIDPTLGIDTNSHKNRFGSEYYGIEIPLNVHFKLLSNKKSRYIPLTYLYWEHLMENDNK